MICGWNFENGHLLICPSILRVKKYIHKAIEMFLVRNKKGTLYTKGTFERQFKKGTQCSTDFRIFG